METLNMLMRCYVRMKKWITITFIIFMSLLSSCAKKDVIDVDTDDLLRYMDRIVIFINQPISSKRDIEKIDLIYVLFDRARMLGKKKVGTEDCRELTVQLKKVWFQTL